MRWFISKAQQQAIATTILSLCLIALLNVFAAAQQAGVSTGGPPVGAFKNPTDDAPIDAQYVTSASNATLTNEQVLQSTGKNITVTQGSGTVTIDLSGQVALTNGGTGGASRQAGINNLLNASSKGEIWYTDGSGNVTALAPSTDGKVLSLSGGIPAWAGSTAGAPTDAEYLVLSANGTLTDERVATKGSGITWTDGGKGGNLTIAVDTAVVLTTGNSITATNKIFDAEVLTTNYKLRGSTFDATITWADWAAARAISIPDPGTTAQFVLSEANSTINGIKTFGSAPKLGTNSLTSSTGNTITVIDSADTLVNLASAQVLLNKELTSPQFSTSTIYKTGSNKYTFTWQALSADRVIDIRDVGGDSRMMLGNSSFAYIAGGFVYGNGNTLSMAGAGSTGQVPVSAGASAPAWGAAAIAGGGTNNGSLAVTQGTVYYGDGTKLVGLAPSTSGFFLQTKGAGANPVWAAASSAVMYGVASKTTTFTVSEASGTLFPCSCAGGSYTGTLPASPTNGDVYKFFVSVAGGTLTLGGNGNNIINAGSSAATLPGIGLTSGVVEVIFVSGLGWIVS